MSATCWRNAQTCWPTLPSGRSATWPGWTPAGRPRKRRPSPAWTALDFPLPAAGRPGKDVLALLDEAASPATVASGGPRYFGFVIGGALPAAQAAAWLTAAWDQNAALTVMSPAAARLDAVALRWVTELLGLPPGTGGGFVTGATHGQRHLPGRGPGRGAQPARLGCGRRGPGRRAPGHRAGRRAGAHHACARRSA